MRSNPAVQEAVAVLNGCLRTSEAKALLFQGPFQRFSQLWASDLPAALQAWPLCLAAIEGDSRTADSLPQLSQQEWCRVLTWLASLRQC